MWLRIFTVVMLFVLVGLVLTHPLTVGNTPPLHAKRHELLVYTEHALAFTSALIVAITGAGVGAILLVRRAKEEFRRQSLVNMQALVEGVNQDRQKPASTANEPVD